MIIVFLFCIFFIKIDKVFASRGDIVYNIDKMTVSATGSVTFQGWAFVHDVNNDAPLITITASNGSSHSVNGAGYNFYTFMCNRDSNNNCISSSSYQYKNIAFSITFTASELMSESPVQFAIRVQSSGYSPSTNLMVYNGNIVGSGNFEISGQATQARVIASNARIQKSTGGKYYEHFYWKNNTVYSVSSYNRSTSGHPGIYMLSYSMSGTNYCLVNSGSFSVSPGSDCQNGSYASWVQILDENGKMDGISIKIDNKCLDPSYAKEHPDECDGGGNNDGACGTGEVKNLELSCSDGTYNHCTAESYSVTVNADNVPSNALSSSGECPASKLSGQVTSTIHRTEKADLKFELVSNPNPLLTGMGFFYQAVYTNETSYEYKIEPECPELYYYIEETSPCREFYEKDGILYYYDTTCTTCTKQTLTSSKCRTKMDAKNLIEKEIASHYNGVDAQTDVTFADGGTSGDIQCNSPSVSSWSEGQKLTSTCIYELDDANIKRTTGEVVYGSYSNMDKYDEIYINEGKQYFIPITTPTGRFDVDAIFQELGVKGMNQENKWSAIYNCGADCINKYSCDVIGNCPGTDPTNPSDITDVFGFYYRPISLIDPFPNRQAGENWYTWISSLKNQERLKSTYDNAPEYVVKLTNQAMSEIRAYNKEIGSYLDNSINYKGESEFIQKFSNIITSMPNETIYELGRGPLK